MTDKNLKEIVVAGKLFIPGTDLIYDVLSPHPVRDIENWQAQGNIYRFYVATGEGSKARVITVNGPYVFDPHTEGNTMRVQIEQEEEEVKNTNYSFVFDDLLKLKKPN